MTVFKCKMCGGALEVEQNQTVVTCEYCGTQQTLPKLDDDRRANLYDRANHFRRNNEFDKAMGIYEQILTEDNTDAEAYWSLVLCRYGIEYVEDPATHKRIPTVNRAQFTSIFDDDNYKSALENADAYQRQIYEEEAKTINEIQKGILAISQKEEPFDVFICYKETDHSGRRTPDSVLANDLYHQLTQEGFKVFFARITLEDKLGTAYEPYIFAALNSAKVMVVLGTKPEYFNAVWVKNEWSRYLGLIKQGEKKMLIPAYKDMDPYDLPEEFSHLQAQDMSKLGFMQDLIRGIKKIVQADEPKTTVVKETVVAGSSGNIEALLKRAFMFLEDGDWRSADEYCEKVLDIDPENAQAYLGKLLSELRVRRKIGLTDCEEPFDHSNNYKKVMRFGDETLKSEITLYLDCINARNENERLEGIYRHAKDVMFAADTENTYKEAAQLFDSISEYQDSAALAKECYESAETVRKDAVLADGKSKMGMDVASYEKAIKLFESISGWKDADEQSSICKQKIELLNAKKEADRIESERQAKIRSQKTKKIAMIGTPIVVVVIAFVVILNNVIIPNGKYNDAVALMESGKYDEAISAFQALDGYKDSLEQIENCYENKYVNAVDMMDIDVVQAYEALIDLGDYKDSSEKAKSIYRQYVIENISEAGVGEVVSFGVYEQDNNSSNGKEKVDWIILAKEKDKVFVISKYALDVHPYNFSFYGKTQWEFSDIRKWLNDTFINNAFSDVEQDMIVTTTVSADRNPEYNIDPGNATQDRVFLLSITEANTFFSSDESRKCSATDYAIAQGVWVSDDIFVENKATCWWWLRTPGGESYDVAGVYAGGEIDWYGHFKDHEEIAAVRPALWIDLSY